MQNSVERPTLVNLELEDLPDSHTATRNYIEQLESRITADQIVKANASMDTKRMDWLANPDNKIGNVMLPQECIEAGLLDGLRGMIDEAMNIDQTKSPENNE